MADKEKNSKDMYTSVSAITDADDCLRRWWFHKRCKLPQDQRQATIFGDVHHAVCARFLEADDRGIDKKTGKPVELYPEGWRVMQNRFDKSGTLYKVSDSEAALIKVLIQKAITDGVLVREPGRTVEREFETIIFTKGYAKVILKGFVDLDTQRGIEDHKTTKNKKYLLSKAKLKKSIQMMGYGYERYLKGHKGNLWLCHNGYVKDFDAPLVRKTDVEVKQIEVMEFFNDKILPTVKLMFRYYTEYPPARLDKWRNVPPANNANQSCNHHYGAPCPYMMICGGLVTIDNYLRKYGMSVTDITGKIVHNEKGSQMNSLMNKIKTEQAAQAEAAGSVPVVTAPAEEAAALEVKDQPTSPPAVGGLTAMLAKVQAGAKSLLNVGTAEKAPIEPVEQAVRVVESFTAVATSPSQTLAPVATDKQVAPWYTFQESESECPACKDNDVLGYNSNTEPCMICVNRARAAGKSCPEHYVVDVLEDGKLQFTLTSTNESTTVQVAKEPETKVVIQPVVDQSAVSIADTVKQASLVDPEVLNKAVSSVVSSMSQTEGYMSSIKDQGKELAVDVLGTVGYTLMIGCSYAKTYPGDAEVMYIDILLDVMLQEISEAAGKAWPVIDHFALMQAIDAYIDSLISVIAGHTIISTIPSKGGAHARLVDGLKLHARTIIYPFGG